MRVAMMRGIREERGEIWRRRACAWGVKFEKAQWEKWEGIDALQSKLDGMPSLHRLREITSTVFLISSAEMAGNGGGLPHHQRNITRETASAIAAHQNYVAPVCNEGSY